jgi:hypothetical protein
MTNLAMRSDFVDSLIAQIAASPPVFVLSRPPPF